MSNESVDPYVDPATGLLRNCLGIDDPDRLHEAEAGLTFAATQDLGTRLLPGAYDLPHLQAFHREIFGDIYPWAGEIRTVAIAKTDMFCLPQHIEPYAAEVFGQLAKERCLHGLPRVRFVDRVTLLCRGERDPSLPEGNGRTQRAFFHQLAREAGWPIDWSSLEAEQNTSASIASLRGDNRQLRAMLDQLIADKA